MCQNCEQSPFNTDSCTRWCFGIHFSKWCNAYNLQWFVFICTGTLMSDNPPNVCLVVCATAGTYCKESRCSFDDWLTDCLLLYDRYYSALNSSRFALVPCGINPESYRLWEVLHSGAIPIVETCGDASIHPFAALPGAIDLLPSVWSWSQLPKVW